MEYLLKCSCGREHAVARKQAGQKLHCECGQEPQVPTLRELTKLPTAAPPSKGIPKSLDSQTTWQGWRGKVMALCTLGLIVASLYTAYAALQAYRNNLNYTVEDDIAQGNEAFDAYGPDELSILWDDFQVLGLRNRVTPTFELYNLYVKEMTGKAMVGGGITAGFGLICVLVWATVPRKRES